jgi:hypothetical protein
VPAESSRLRRRLGARERLFIAAIACAVVAAVPIGIVVAHQGSGGPPRHCVTELRASIMGGATFTFCGKAANRECVRAAAKIASLAAQCRRLGID